MDQLADNFNSDANEDDGNCIYFGCTDINAINYDSLANEDDGTCLILGCMNSSACNYNSNATLDNGSCIYPDSYYDCEGNCINDIDLDGECDEIDYDDGIGIDEVEDSSMKLIRMIDVLGREYNEHKPGLLLFYIYDNGEVKKLMKY